MLQHLESRPPMTQPSKKSNLKGRIEQICQYITTRKVYVESIAEHIELRLDKHKNLKKLCTDYQLFSPNLDGSMQEILEKVKEITDNDSMLLVELFEREADGVQCLVAEVKEIVKQLLGLRRKELDQETCEAGSGEPAVRK